MQIGHTRDDAALSEGRIPLVVGPTASPRGGVAADVASWVIPLPWLGPGARLIVSGVCSPKKICTLMALRQPLMLRHGTTSRAIFPAGANSRPTLR